MSELSLNADLADLADLKPEQNFFRSVPFFFVLFSCVSCDSWFLLLRCYPGNLSGGQKTKPRITRNTRKRARKKTISPLLDPS
jgi:hypothetical protein